MNKAKTNLKKKKKTNHALFPSAAGADLAANAAARAAARRGAADPGARGRPGAAAAPRGRHQRDHRHRPTRLSSRIQIIPLLCEIYPLSILSL